MICSNCQKEIEDNDKYCRYCGKLQLHTDTEGENIVLSALRSAFASKLFLAICVLMTVSLICSLSSYSFPVLTLLFVLYFWIAFSRSRRLKLKESLIKRINGVTIVQKVLGWVNVGVCAIIITFLAIFGEATMSYAVTHIYDFKVMINKMPVLFQSLFDDLIIVGIVIFGLIMICQIVFNLTFKNTLKKFNKSVLKALQSGSFEEIRKAETFKNWLYVIAGILLVFSIRLTTNNYITCIGNASLAASCILSGLMINAIFIDHDELN